MNERCGNCRFFSGVDPEPGQTATDGQCRVWPRVLLQRPDGWCGQWQGKIDTHEQDADGLVVMTRSEWDLAAEAVRHYIQVLEQKKEKKVLDIAYFLVERMGNQARALGILNEVETL